jgi:vitamin B12 transporter
MTDSDFSAFPARTVTLKAFTLVNLAGAWKLTEQVETFGRIENLADRAYREVYGFNAAGRAAYAGLRVRF